MLHCILGLVTEMAEMMNASSPENFREELGDLMWYVAIGCNHLGATFDSAVKTFGRPADETRDPVIVVGDLADLVKREIFYGKVMDFEKAVALLGELILISQNTAEGEGWVFQDVLAENIAKLQKRYPDKFSEERAVNR